MPFAQPVPPAFAALTVAFETDVAAATVVEVAASTVFFFMPALTDLSSLWNVALVGIVKLASATSGDGLDDSVGAFDLRTGGAMGTLADAIVARGPISVVNARRMSRLSSGE